MKRITNQYSISRLHVGRDTGIHYDSLLYFFEFSCRGKSCCWFGKSLTSWQVADFPLRCCAGARGWIEKRIRKIDKTLFDWILHFSSLAGGMNHLMLPTPFNITTMSASIRGWNKCKNPRSWHTSCPSPPSHQLHHGTVMAFSESTFPRITTQKMKCTKTMSLKSSELEKRKLSWQMEWFIN